MNAPAKPRKKSKARPAPASRRPGPAPAQRVVLFAVTGMSPAVLTESAWALARSHPPVIPERVVVATTIAGRQALEQELLTPVSAGGQDLWQRLRISILGESASTREQLILEPPRVIEAPNPRTGRMNGLEDLRTADENMATADFLLAELRRWTECPDTRLIVSIAGGRKTMGALLYACVSLIGRETDRITHVLAREPFDNPRLTPRFYFPDQPCQDLTLPGGVTARASGARVELADIPFVPLRNLFQRDLVRKPSTFAELVARCRMEVRQIERGQVRISLRYDRRVVEVSGRQLRLPPRQMLLLLFLARNAVEQRPPPAKQDSAIEPLREFSEHLKRQCRSHDFNDWRDAAGLPADFDGQELRKTLTALRATFRKAGPPASDIVPLLPAGTRFTLDVDPGMIDLS